MLQLNWGKVLPKIGKWLIFTSKDKKVTYSNASLKLQEKRKYAIKLIPSQKNIIRKILYFFCGKKTKRCYKSFAKSKIDVFTIAYVI